MSVNPVQANSNGWMRMSGGGSHLLNRRRVLGLGASLGAAALVSTGCSPTTGDKTGQGTTIDQLKIIVPADVGGGWDQTGRRFEQVATEGSFVPKASVENIGGAGGTRGLAALANEKDFETLMVTGLVMVGAVESNASKSRIEQTTPIARLTEEPLLIVVAADSPYKTLKDLVTAIGEKGRDIPITGGSAGGADHMLGALLLKAGNVEVDKLNYIPNSGGGDAVTKIINKSVAAGISGVGEFVSYVEAGKFRALAASSDKPAQLLPDVPTIKDAGFDLVLTNWRGLLAPGGIEAAQRQALIDLVTKIAQSEQWKKVMKDSGWTDAFMADKDFDTFIAKNITEVGETLRSIDLAK